MDKTAETQDQRHIDKSAKIKYDNINIEDLRRWARQGACIVGLKEKMIKIAAEITERRPQFTPLKLSGGNVQAIFDRCLAADGVTETTVSSLYFSSLGWKKEDDGLLFDKNNLHANQKNIQYLVGQLKPVHEGQRILTLEDMTKTYQGTNWVSDRAYLMQLLYLGSSDEFTVFFPLVAKWNGTTLNMPITPTLSPEDPNFPAWWEAHKAEWEA